MNYLLVVQVFVRTPSWGLVGHFCVEINTHVLPAVWERHDPAAARSQNEALHADAHVALQALPQNHAQMRRSNAGTGRVGRNT